MDSNSDSCPPASSCPQQFHLKWNNHSVNTLSSFQSLLDTHTLVDVSLTCANGKIVEAHRMVLAACSDYFYKLFKELSNEKHPVIIFKDADEQVLKDLLLFMYRGEVEVKESHLADFLKFADTLQVKGLSQGENSSTSATSSNSNIATKDTMFSANNSSVSSAASALCNLASTAKKGRRSKTVNSPKPEPTVTTSTSSMPSFPTPAPDPLAKSYLAAAMKFPPMLPLPFMAPAPDSSNLLLALQGKYGPPQENLFKMSPLFKSIFPQPEAEPAPHLFEDSESLATDRSVTPPAAESATSNDGNNNSSNVRAPKTEEESETETLSGSRQKSAGRGSRLERMIAAEYKILSEYSEPAPEQALPVMTPELMKSRRTHSLQLAIGEILHNRASVQSAATKYHIPRETLRRHYQRYLKAMGIKKAPLAKGNEESNDKETSDNDNNKSGNNEEGGSNGFSSLMEIGQAYGIWSPDVAHDVKRRREGDNDNNNRDLVIDEDDDDMDEDMDDDEHIDVVTETTDKKEDENRSEQNDN